MESLCAPYDREFVAEEDLASNFAVKHKDEDLRFRMEFEVENIYIQPKPGRGWSVMQPKRFI